jgi:DNA polymerase III alpha subunit
LTPRLAHLHLGRGFSYGCWVAIAEELIKAAGETGMGSLALTDEHGHCGHPEVTRGW